MSRRRSGSPNTFEQNIAEAKSCFHIEAAKLAPGPQLDELEQKLGQLETAASWNTMLSVRQSKASK